MDAKGQAAGAMLAALRLSSPHVALLLVCGEETDHAGMKAAHKLGFSNGVILLNLEPTESRIATFQKGMLKGILRVKGKSAHSGYPHLGHSAVHKLLQVLPDLRRISGDGMTVNVGVIEGGSAANVVADSASATLLWRLVDEVENVRTAIMDVVRQHQNVSFDIITQNGPRKFLVPKEAKRRLGTTDVAYNTDVPYYKGETRGAVLFGAGSIRHAHTDNEIIDVEELLLLPERLMEIAREVLTDEE